MTKFLANDQNLVKLIKKQLKIIPLSYKSTINFFFDVYMYVHVGAKEATDAVASFKPM